MVVGEQSENENEKASETLLDVTAHLRSEEVLLVCLNVIDFL